MIAEPTTEARRQIVAGLVRQQPDMPLAAVRRAVRAAGHQVGDSTLRKDIAQVRGEIEQEAIHRRQELVATLLARKLTVREIRRALAGHGFTVSERTIWGDVAAVRQIWKERCATALDDLRAQEWAELEEMERTCAQEMASCDKGDHASKARYLAERRQIKARKAALRGLDAPVEVKHGGEIDVRGGLSDAERRALAAEIAAMGSVQVAAGGSAAGEDDDGDDADD